MKDYFYAAIFLLELTAAERHRVRPIFNELTKNLKEENRDELWTLSTRYWIKNHSLDYCLVDGKKDDNVLSVCIGELDSELEQSERTINDLNIPSGMSAYDTAILTQAYTKQKMGLRLRIKALYTIKDRIKSDCFNYAVRLESQLQAQSKSIDFLHQVQTDVNNYFKTHSEEVYTKLLKAVQLVDSNDPEDFSLLLTEVRRAINAAADFFYPPVSGLVKCSDCEERMLGEKEYMNRLKEYLAVAFENSKSRELLRAEFELLSIFARRLDGIASKGVHAKASQAEAKQALLGLYMFLFNVISHLQEKDS
jgi:hypothetical protein